MQKSTRDLMELSRLWENRDLSTDFHCDFPLWASLVALWSPNVSDGAPIVLLSADSGSWPRGPLCFMGPSSDPFQYFMALLAFSLGRG